MKKTYKFLNKAMTYLGLGLIAFGLLLFVVRQMSSDNPQNQTESTSTQSQPKASNNQLLTTPTPIPVPFNAYFAIFTNNTFRLFDAARYHNLDTNAFIEGPQNPNKITVAAPTITWGYFFNTLPMEVTSDCLTTGTGQTFCTNTTSSLRFYINGQEEHDALSKVINQNDRLLITYGGTNSAQVESQLKRLDEIE